MSYEHNHLLSHLPSVQEQRKARELEDLRRAGKVVLRWDSNGNVDYVRTKGERPASDPRSSNPQPRRR